MIAIIMAGGKGKRLNKNIEKPLLRIEGKTILERISTVLKDVEVDEILVAVTKNTPETRKEAERLKLKILQTPGKGYVEDIQYLVGKFKEFLTISADLPFLTQSLIKDVLTKYKEMKCPISLVTPKKSYEEMGFTPSVTLDSLVPIGVNVVAKGEDYFHIINGKATININTSEELERI